MPPTLTVAPRVGLWPYSPPSPRFSPRQGWLETWTDQALQPGASWEDSLREALKVADLILLLISPDFMASDYIQEVEPAAALERHKSGAARVVPIVLRKTDLKGTVVDSLQALPSDRKPVNL